MAARRYLQLDDRAWLHHLYVEEQRSYRSIAAIVGCTPSAARSALRVYGIPTRAISPGTRRPIRATVRDPVLAARLGMVAGKEVIA